CKGERVLHTERYQGQGWGLLQVLESMHGTGDADAVDEFARAARATLTRRVHNAPAGRHESRWLTGWIRRVNSYNGGENYDGKDIHTGLFIVADCFYLFDQRPVTSLLTPEPKTERP